ncbi:MAG TPA: PEP-CTERM sorting domain-containing protein, partial [Candidatus Methylacidiphilales bacterium]
LLMTINNTSGTSSVTDTLIFNLDTVGYQGISLSYAGRYYGTNPTFTWSYSTDGTNYTTLTPTKTGSLTAAGSFYDISYAFGSSLDNLSAVSLKLSFTANAGVNLSYGIDNLQVLASSPLAVPEPSAWLLFGAGGMLLALAGRARRRSFPVFQS